MRLAELRKKNNISQAELSKAIGYSQNMISRWENGSRDPNTQTIKVIADYFGVTTDYLLGDEQKNRLNELRKERKLSQADLAKAIGCSQNIISQWENGTRVPSMQMAMVLANYFNVPLDYLMGESQPVPETKKIPKDLKKILEDEEVTLNGRMMSDEDKEKMMRIIEAAFYEAKEMNKRK